MSAENQMRELFKVFYEQCPYEKITYTASEVRHGHLQSWIVMNGIELSYMMYQGKYQIVFMCNRYLPETDDTTYYFNNYNDCARVWQMDEHLLSEYAK